MSEHTPTPWFVGPTPRYLSMMQGADGNARRTDPITLRSNAHSEEIATVWTYLLPTEANAAFIVRAVNSHEDLVAALRKIIAWDADDEDGLASRGQLDAALEAGRAALSKATGETE